ncbi:MAG TPA: hypothetical protein VM866_02185 [Pyrinomonadaceae bacterium]|nr:hypothetical protein [Pyrinomonadaceae bacterium]
MRDVGETREESGEKEVVAPSLAQTIPSSQKTFSATPGTPSSLIPDSRSRLTHLLIAKSLLEMLFVGSLAVFFYYQTFNVYIRGSLDAADARNVAGWAVDEGEPQRRVVVQLYINDRFVASREADAFRPDVLAAGRAADERHGFMFDTPALPPGDYEARVYAQHESSGEGRRTLQIIGRPLKFQIIHDAR